MLPFQYMYRYRELTGKGNFHLFAPNRKQKQQTSVCWKWKMKMEFVFLGRQTKNGNQRLLFQQTCPSMRISRRIDSVYMCTDKHSAHHMQLRYLNRFCVRSSDKQTP